MATPPPTAGSAKSERLRRFRQAVERQDRETVEFWSNAPASAHAAAMIELCEYAEQMAARTGLGKREAEMFPGFPPLRAERRPDRMTTSDGC